ncbi:MAG: extracellular catalytic domain type 1 short-chain-length polyhydroxyalkanoate depolymerase [Trebonia sp.]
MRRLLRAIVTAAAALAAVTMLAAVPAITGGSAAKAAGLVQITNFGNNPANNKMYIYVPANVQANPPILVALHQCTGTGPGFYSSTAFASLADQYGFIVIYPDANRSGQCWDVSSSQALTRNGGSDPVGIMSMITYAEQNYHGNPNAVYVTGASSGAMMTNVMLADYPDVFKAGVAFMGVPYYCFYTGTVDGWNSACADGQTSMTAQAWGNLARNADPGYSGARPRMEVWHGTADTTLNYNNFGQEILQWTNVLGVSSTPATTSTPESGWTETTYGGSGATPPVEGISIAGAGHVLPIEGEGMEADAIDFMGLNQSVSTGHTVTVTNPGAQTSTVNTAASLQIHATDSASAALTYSATGLPAGLSINSSTGLISGTPTATTSSPASVTVTATDSSGVSGTATFTWSVTGSSTSPPPSGCQATYSTTSQWTGGFTASVTITAGSSAINGWTLGFTYPGDQHVTSSWNGTATQSGENVTITNASYNGSIAANGSTSIGFQGTWTASDAAPTAFTVNGAACTA